MEITQEAQDYADSFRYLNRLRDKTAKGAYRVRGVRDPHAERFRRAAEKIYGDLVGDDPWRFFEEMTESLAYKFANASGLDYEHAARALVNYSSDPRPGLSLLLRAIERERAQKNPDEDPFQFHLKPSGWTGAPCPICGCTTRNLRAKHRALKADEAHRWGVPYIKRVKVAFGTDFSDEPLKE